VAVRELRPITSGGGARTGRKDFDGNITVEVLIVFAVDLSPAASAVLLDGAVVTEIIADERILVERRTPMRESTPSPSPHT